MAALDTIFYVEQSQDAGRRFMQRSAGGRVIMLKLLRFRGHRAAAIEDSRLILLMEAPFSLNTDGIRL